MSPDTSIETAALTFVHAVLRREEGEPISASERATFDRLYLPLPDDSQAIRERKAANRERAAMNLEAGMPSDIILRQQEMFWRTQNERAAEETAA